MQNNLDESLKHRGFTLVELIVVIILIGILSVSVFSRFSGKSGFSEYTYQARLISALRNMQTRAMHDTRDDYCFQINFITATTDVAFGPPVLNYITDDASAVAATCSSNIDFNNADHLITSETEMSDEGVGLTTEPRFDSIGFDTLGRPTIASGNCSTSCKVTFTGESTVSVCIESQGYIHACE